MFLSHSLSISLSPSRPLSPSTSLPLSPSPFIQKRGEDPLKGSKRKYLDFIDILLEARVSLPTSCFVGMCIFSSASKM